MLSGQVALVTGASRGIGRGIALQLGAAGATVYVTGRRPEKVEDITKALRLPSLQSTANEVNQRGGKGIAVYCDHSDANDIKQLFQTIGQEQNQRLDILVNNAYSAVATVSRSTGVKFFDLDPTIWDQVNNVGLRNHYICSVYAAKLMVPRKSGLIVTVSSSGGLRFLFNTAYGVGKAACDRLAADMAHELQPYGITSIALWPGPVKTEIIQKTILAKGDGIKDRGGQFSAAETKALFENAETVEMSGKCIVALAGDQKRLAKTGRILTTMELAKEYGIYEDDGKTQPYDPMAASFSDYLQTFNQVRAPKSKM